MEKFSNESELALALEENKAMLDAAYEETKKKYGIAQANLAMYNYLLTYYTKNFTRNNNSRKNMEAFLFYPNNFYQILLDFAISSHMLSESEKKQDYNISLEEIRAYTDTENESLNYDPKHITSVVAIATAWSPYWTVDLLSCNKKVKQALVTQLVTERYIQNKKEELDNSRRVMLVNIGHGNHVIMSKENLNRNIDNMNRDDGIVSNSRPHH